MTEMKRKRITLTTGTRAEYGILRPLMREIQARKELELIVIVAGMHLSPKYGMTVKEIIKERFPIGAMVRMDPKSDDGYGMAVAFAKGVESFARVFSKFQPDINVILGDRDEAFASACAAFHMNIVNAHIHGGDITGGIDEYIRHAITKLSNVHFAATLASKKRILALGENNEYVFNTGSPSVDEIIEANIPSNAVIQKKYRVNSPYLILIQHPVTTQVNQTKEQIKETLSAVSSINLRTIIIGPNSDAGSSIIRAELKRFLKDHPLCSYHKSIPRKEYLRLLSMCSALVGNSSSGLIDAPSYKIPVVNIGIRQAGRERGLNVIDADTNGESILKAINKCIYDQEFKKVLQKSTNPYGNGKASLRIAKILSSLKLGPELRIKRMGD
jgi:GDP/UDP-N,N'-diacetylbacillosamine 2-epimerase (hydrolysing)